MTNTRSSKNKSVHLRITYADACKRKLPSSNLTIHDYCGVSYYNYGILSPKAPFELVRPL